MGGPKVFFFTEHYPPKIGGSSKYATRISTELARMGAELFLVTYDYGKLARSLAPGLHEFRIKVPPFLRKERFFPVLALPATLHLLRTVQPNLIHVGYGFFGILLGSFIGKLRQIPVVFTVNNMPRREMVTPFSVNSKILRNTHLWLTERLGTIACSLGSDIIICPSIHTAKAVIAAGVPEERIVVIAHGVDVVPRTRTKPRSNTGLRILSVGGIAPHKAQSILLQALPTVLERFPTTKTVLVGSVRDRAYWRMLRRFVQQSGLDHHVEFLLNVNEDEKAELYRDCNLYVQPSLEEGYCLAVLEAMAAGCPVVGTSTGAIPEIISKSGAGIVVLPGSPSELARAIVELLSSESRRIDMGRRGREYALKEATWEQAAAKTLAVYMQCA